jgi:hypothetical protein
MTPHLAIAQRPQEEKETAPAGHFKANDIVDFVMGTLPGHKTDGFIIYMQGSLFNPNHFNRPEDKGLSFEGKLKAREARIREKLKVQHPILHQIDAKSTPDQEAERLNLPQHMKVESMCAPVRRWMAEGGKPQICVMTEDGRVVKFAANKSMPTLALV